MNTERQKCLVKEELDRNEGLLRLAPAWVPRSFLMPGGRLKLAKEDLYALGKDRGGIDERWLASTIMADNGPVTPEDEGLSYITLNNGKDKVLLKDAIELLGDDILGKDIMEKYGGWKVLAKFFDNLGPIPHHMHQMDKHAKKVGREGKPEAYYFPRQLNLIENNFPYTFFGFEPGTTKENVKKCLENWNKGDNEILDLSKAYRLRPGTGWDVPTGILHAPGSLVTYEPQKASDVFSMFQSMVEGRSVPWELVVKDVPEEQQNDLDYLIDMLDWEANVDPEFKKNRFLLPKPVNDCSTMREEGYIENWIVYGSSDFSAKELTVFPGKEVIVKDESAYGLILLQGYGIIGSLEVETPTLIRYGELTKDELFVSRNTAENGLQIINKSDREELVLLKHFGPGN